MQKKKMNESIEDMMPASPDEKSMAMRQAKFIEYVAEEIEEYLENNRAFPEWMQNKLSALHQKAKDMHAVMAGDYEDDEEEEDDEDMNEDVKKMSMSEGLWANIQAKRKRGEAPAKPGDKDYPSRDAIKSAQKESVELDELSKKTLGSYIKKASDDRAQNAYNVGKSGKINYKGLKRRQGISTAADKLAKEEVEQLDELSPNTLHRYVKKASVDLVGRSVGAAAGDKKSQKKVGQRLAGISGASGRMSDKANQNESYINEKLSVSDGMAAWIDDFKKSDAPQFKGKSDKERRDMAIAAFLDAKKGPQNEKFVSAAQRKAVWATKADGGKGHPDNKGKKK